MKYMGSKRLLAKHILPLILKNRKHGQWYVEPFVGGGNLINHVDGNVIASDVNKNTISALNIIRDNPYLLPKNKNEFTEDDYLKVKKDKDHPLHGYVSFALSYGGKEWGGWCRDKQGVRDYVREAYFNALKQSMSLKNVHLVNTSYNDLDVPKNSIIYCDPPYKDTTKYTHDFDHDEFWEWCKKKHNDGHSVFISEYTAPEFTNELWRKQINSSLSKDTGSKKATEKLFTIRD